MADPLLLAYRADWTQWSLSAEVVRRRDRRLSAQVTNRLAADMRRRSGGMTPFIGSVLSATKRTGADGAAARWTETTERILLAPGGRYRFEPAEGQPAADRGADDSRGEAHHEEADHEEADDDEQVRLIVSDGESCWVIWGAEADQSVADLAHPPMSHIVRPTWLMCQLQFTTTGTTEVAGRPALQVRGIPRLPSDRWALLAALLDRVDIAIDAELGLVLRYETVFDGQPLSSLEVTELVVNPSAAADPASFRPDDGVEVDQNGIGPPESHLFWRGDYGPDPKIDRRRLALSMARGAVYLAARQLARPEPATPEPATPEPTGAERPDAPPPARVPPPATPGSHRPVSDAVLHLITHTGMAPVKLTARVHHWLDGALARRSVPMLAVGANIHEVPGTSGFLGSEEDSFIHYLRDSHRTARLTLAMPDRYRIDFEREDRRRHPLTVACDGEQLRKVYHNRVVASPPLPLPTDFVRLVDPAWLLRDWPLSEAGEQAVGGRTAIELIAERPPVRADLRSERTDHTARIALLIDTELGIVLRQVSYLDDEPVSRYEVRDVQPREVIDIADFGGGIAPDLPVFRTNGEPIGDLDLPDSARAVGQATTELVNGARSAFGWLADQARKVSGG